MAFESDPIAAKLNNFVSSREAYMWLMWFDELTLAEQALIATWELEQEVYNGGFMQYFQNSSGERVPFICKILRTVEANKVASVLDRAIELAGPNIPWDDELRRCAMLKALSDDSKSKLFHMSDELYEQLDDLNSLLFRYLSKHRDQLDAPEEFWAEEATNK
jgi:hypothetical protein